MRIALWLLLLLPGVARAWGLDPAQPLSAFGRQVWTTENGLPQNTVRSLKQTPDGFLWLRTEEGVVRFDGVEFRAFDGEAGLAVEDGRKGSARPAGQDERVRMSGLQTALPREMGAVRVLLEDREGALWAGCDGGLARVARGAVEVMRGSAVLSLMEDREGNLWVGTEAEGLMELHEQPFMTYGVEEGLGGNVVRAVIEDARGTVWVGTDGGGLSRRVGGRYAGVPGLSSNVVLALAASADGDVWAGTPTGLNRVRGGAVKVYRAEQGLADDYIRSLLVDRGGAVWAGTRHGLTRMDTRGAMTTFTSLDGLGSDLVGVMVEARQGGLWIGTSGGLTRWDGSRFSNVRLTDRLAHEVVTAIHEDQDGVLWLGTSGGGLARMRAGVILPVAAENLPASISSVLEDGAGRLWIGSRRGVLRVARAELERVIAAGGGRVALTAYDTSDGMRVRECSSGGHPAAMRVRGGTFWFATLRGVSVVDPARLHENAVPPLVALETMLVNDQPQALDRRAGGGELTLAPGPGRVEFQYAGLSFVAPTKVRYRYRLGEIDRDWVDAGERRAAFYTNLQPGRYVFHVTAANNDGVWSEHDATIGLRVRPFFWQTAWFWMLALLAAAGLAWLVYARRVRRVEVMYRGVMEERGRIAREIHDGLAQGIVSISLQLEIVGRLLGSSTEAARAQLDQTRALVRQSLAEARSSIWELREEGAGELPVRVGRALKALTPEGSLTVTGTYRALDRSVEDEVLKIAQEAMTNAVRHGGGTEVAVTLTYEMKMLRLKVRDRGPGFDANAPEPPGHFGLQGMRERADRIGARLVMRSALDEGTEALLECPLV